MCESERESDIDFGRARQFLLNRLHGHSLGFIDVKILFEALVL